MSKIISVLFYILFSTFTVAITAQALPDKSEDDAIAWFNRNPSIAPLQPTQKYEPGMSDFDSTTQLNNGKVHLTVFLNPLKRVTSETIDYRPECYGSLSCSGSMRFEKAEGSTGHSLIQQVWGREILEDFRASTLIEVFSGQGMKRWYQGKLYNYETWHYTNYTITHFSVVSKRDNQGRRIQQYIHCVKNPRECGP